MNVHFSIYRLNKKTRETILGTLFSADDEKILELLGSMNIYPSDSEFPHYNYLKLGREIEYEGDRYKVEDFKIRTTNDEKVLKIKIFVIKI